MCLDAVREAALKYALQNAVRHDGRAMVKPVLNKIFGEMPEARRRVREVKAIVEEVVREVNAMTIEKQRSMLEERWPEALEARRVEEKGLPPLPNVEKYRRVVTRFAPNPDFVLTLGNARPAILSYEYARMYRGEFILRFEDTDPKTKTPILEAYELIREDLGWLGLKWDREYVQSLRMPVYYMLARELLERGGAYVCTHSPGELRELRAKGRRCKCAGLPLGDQLERWDRMISGGYGEGEAVLRVKTDPRHPDPSVRDWVAFRIIDTSVHPHPVTGDKYCVWPTYNFAAAVDDHLMGVTHILRAKEHISNTVKQKFLYGHFGWRYPETIHFGRLKLEGTILSKSKMRAGISAGRYLGWDDPRLGTLRALRRRGFYPETIWEIIMDVGVKSSEATISLSNIYAVNRRRLEDEADRYMFTPNPVLLTVKGVRTETEVKLPYHPSHPERGIRVIRLIPREGAVKVYLALGDLASFREGDVVRLMGFANVRLVKVARDGGVAEFHSCSVEDARALNAPIIQWCPLDGVRVSVLKPERDELRVIEGLAEPAVASLKPETRIQFFRFGFVKVEKVGRGEIGCVYIHD